MSKFRIEALSDAVFAIVMTLLVIEIKVPELHSKFSEGSLLHELEKLSPLFFAYFLSSAIIATFWFSHNFMYSLLAKNLNRTVINLNFVFLAFLSLIPFATHLLGAYPESQVAVFVYAANVAIMGLITWWIRSYIFNEPTIENPHFHEINLTRNDIRYGSIRIYINILGAVVAVLVSFISTYAALAILVAQAVILILPGAVQKLSIVFGLDKLPLTKKWQDCEFASEKSSK
jgi:uncharacterized membrane protein